MARRGQTNQDLGKRMQGEGAARPKRRCLSPRGKELEPWKELGLGLGTLV